MNKFLTKAALGLTLGATALTAAGPADARGYYGRGYRHHDNGGTAVVAGIAGLAIGAALASGANDRRYRDDYYRSRGYAYDYDDRYYRQRGYYPNDGYYAYNYRNRGYRDCRVERRWDPYSRRNVRIRIC